VCIHIIAFLSSVVFFVILVASKEGDNDKERMAWIWTGVSWEGVELNKIESNFKEQKSRKNKLQKVTKREQQKTQKS
jgi:hypothetical protein